MVKLNKIYTRGGDDGTTALADGTRVPKHGPRIAAQGDVDEANAAIGVARAHVATAGFEDILALVQNDMFDVGADITVPDDGKMEGALRIQKSQVDRLEAEIDRVNADLAPLTSFVLRGGCVEAAQLHVACTVARRAERSSVALNAAEPLNPLVLAYLNRLSDLLFVMARKANDDGRTDVLWQPGMTAD